jgi:hypothetical protein
MVRMAKLLLFFYESLLIGQNKNENLLIIIVFGIFSKEKGKNISQYSVTFLKYCKYIYRKKNYCKYIVVFLYTHVLSRVTNVDFANVLQI